MLRPGAWSTHWGMTSGSASGAASPSASAGSSSAGWRDSGQLVGIHPEQVGDLLDDHIMDEIGEILAVHGPKFERPPVEHDPRRELLAAGPAGEQPGERHLAVL